MRALASSTIDNIISTLQNGTSVTQTAKEHNVSPSTVSKYKNLRGLHVTRSTGGRPATLSLTARHRARRLIRSGVCSTAVDVAKELSEDRADPVQPWTVRRALKNQKMKAVRTKKKPLLNQGHRTARLRWARQHQGITVEDRKQVIWSDETKINRLDNDRPLQMWADEQTVLEVHYYQRTMKFVGENIMFWDL